MTPEQIKALRVKMDLHVDAFAARIGVNRATVYRWENENKKPQGAALKALQRLWKRHMPPTA